MQTSIAPDRFQRLSVLAKAALMFSLALYFGLTILTGNLSNYINVRVGWPSYLAVVLFTVLGAAVLFELRDPSRRSHTLIRMPSLILMAVPLALGTLIPSKPLGADSIEAGSLRLGSFSFGTANVALVDKPVLERNVLDWSRMFMGNASPTVFNDQPARVLGFVYHEPGFPDDTFMVARFTVSCCVADAIPLGLPAYYKGAADLEEGMWIEVEGTFRAQDFLGDEVPVLQVAKLTPTTAPAEPYIYP